jgi:hypothetical protein
MTGVENMGVELSEVAQRVTDATGVRAWGR